MMLCGGVRAKIKIDVLFMGIAFFATLCPKNIWAQSAPPPSIAPSDDVQMPAPPRVLQNRFFVKAMRPEFSVFSGVVLNESYSNTYVLGARGGIFFSEEFGIDYGYSYFTSRESTDLRAIREQRYCKDAACNTKQYLEPSFTLLKKAHSVSLTFAPIYGKISLRDRFIIYSDIYFSAGAARFDTSSGKKTAAIVGLGQRFYFAKNYNIRIDAVDNIMEEERKDRDGEKKGYRNAWVVTLGLSAFLW